MDEKPTYEQLEQRVALLENEAKRAKELLEKSECKLSESTNQIEQFSLSAASMLSIKDENVIFDKISQAIVEFSDFRRVLISLFKDEHPYRELIGHGGISDELVQKIRKVPLPKSWYDHVFSQGLHLGHFSYYIPHTMKDILNQEATIYGDGPTPVDSTAWHPEDNLFVRMNDENGQFIGVISVDDSKCGLRPSLEVIRPLEIYASLIAQIIIFKRTQAKREVLEEQLKLSQKMESIGQLAGGIAHDFNNILSSILGFSELALDDVEKGTAMEDNLLEIHTGGLRAKEIVKQILAFARQSSEETKPTRVDTIIVEALKLIRPSTPATIEIRQKIESSSRVMGNATQIHQIIMNLCTNAAHAMQENGGLLEVTLKDVVAGSIDIPGGLDKGQYVELTISDTGSGIEQEHIDSIFDPYFTTKDTGEGTGMGLAMVRGIVDNYGGLIKVESNPYVKTVFTIYLPMTTLHDNELLHNEEILPQGNEHILFVDDEPSIARMGGRILKSLGYQVTTKTDSFEALELFKASPDDFQLVITDMTMPHMTGDKFAIELKQIRANNPVILCTGYSNKMNAEIAQEIGINAFVNKPFSKAELANTVKEVLKKS